MPPTYPVPSMSHSPAYYHNHSVLPNLSFHDSAAEYNAQPLSAADARSEHSRDPACPVDAYSRKDRRSDSGWEEARLPLPGSVTVSKGLADVASPISPSHSARAGNQAFDHRSNTRNGHAFAESHQHVGQRSPPDVRGGHGYNATIYNYTPEESGGRDSTDHALRVLVSFVLRTRYLRLLTQASALVVLR